MATSTKTQKIKCARCGGKGRFQAFSHIQAGVCFKCQGVSYIEVSIASIKAAEKRVAKQAAVRQAAADEYNRKMEIAKAMYKGDKRIRVTSEHEWYSVHIYEIAMKDKTWGTF